MRYFIVYKDLSPSYLVIGSYSDVQILLEHGFTVVPIVHMSVAELCFEESDFDV